MAARNVGFNSTFEQQRQVINQIAVDVDTLQNSGLLTSFTESDPVFTASPSSGITTTNISEWNSSYGWGNHAVVGYATEGYVDSSIVGFITSGAISGFVTEGYVGLQTFTGAATTITSSQILNWDEAYGWGNHSTQGYLTDVSITAGANIEVLETSEGNFIITSTGGGTITGIAGTWAVNESGIHTTKYVGIGTTLPTSLLTVNGDGKFSGVVTATKFESSIAGTPTLNSPNNLNINAVVVAISTDVSVGRNITAAGIVSASSVTASTVAASSFSGIGSNITNIRLPWTKFYLNTQNNVKPPVGIITSSDYLGRNWGSWYSCTFLNGSFTAGLSPTNAAYNPTLDGVGFTTDRFFGFLQGATYEFHMELDVYDGAGRSAEVELYTWESSTAAFSNQSIWYPGSAIGNNPLRVHHTALFTFESSTTSNNWVRYKLHSSMSPTYYITQAILTIKKIA